MSATRIIGATILFLLPVPAGGGWLAAQEAMQPTGSGVLVGVVQSGETGEPMGSASVEVLRASDSTRVAQSLTNAEGRFRVERLVEGTYLLRLMHVGYATRSTLPFELASGETRDLGTLILTVQAVSLTPIEVSSERSAVTFEADRTSYNLGVMGGYEGASVTETLSSLPELEVDIEGRVTLRGSAPAIYINGRPAPMSGEALAAFLEQFPADYVQSIEVIDNPSARFAAEGSGGVVNIVLKEGVDLGLSGSVFANAGTRGQYGVGGRGTMQRGAWTLTGGGFGRLSDRETTGYDLRQNLETDPAFLRRDTYSDRGSLSSNIDLSARYQPTEAMRFSARGRVNGSGSDTEGLSTTTHLDEEESPILIYDRASASESRRGSFDFTGGFDYAWEPRRHELEIEVSYREGRRRMDRREEVTGGSFEDEHVLVPAELMLEERHEFERSSSLEMDYTRGLGEGGRLELGLDVEHETSDDDRVLQSLDDGAGAPSTSLRGIDQRQRSNAAYATFRQRMGGLSLQLGLRAEQRDLGFELPGGESVERTDRDVFPSANIAYRSEGRQLRVSYSRRIGRPGPSVLNPTDVSTDPAVRRVGNPDIEPRYTHSINVNASWSGELGSLRFAPYYQRTVNDWAPITTVDEQGISTRTYENLLSAESYGASLTYSLRNRDGWGGNVSVSARQTNRDASNLSSRYSGSSLRWSSRANVNARLTGDLTAQGNFSYSPPTDLPQGRSDAQYRADMGFRYRILDGRGSIRLSLDDPFEVRRNSSRLQDVTYIQIGRSQVSTRAAQINFTYSFGGGGGRRGGGGDGGGRRDR